MRNLKLQVQITADGFIAGPQGEMDWMTFDWDDELKNYVAALTEPVDCILLGRKLAQGFIPHWAAQPRGEDAWFVDKMNLSAKVVFTQTLAHSKWDNTVLAKGNLAEEVGRLKREASGDMIAYGGATFVSALIRENLIDDLYLFVNPVALGSGLAIFTDRTNLQLVSAHAFNCGIVAHHYRPRG